MYGILHTSLDNNCSCYVWRTLYLPFTSFPFLQPFFFLSPSTPQPAPPFPSNGWKIKAAWCGTSIPWYRIKEKIGTPSLEIAAIFFLFFLAANAWKKLNRKKCVKSFKKIYNKCNKLGVNVLYWKPKYIIYFFLKKKKKLKNLAEVKIDLILSGWIYSRKFPWRVFSS